MWEPGDDGGVITEYATSEVVVVAFPLVKFKAHAIAGGDEVIINTASMAFVSAESRERFNAGTSLNGCSKMPAAVFVSTPGVPADQGTAPAMRGCDW